MPGLVNALASKMPASDLRSLLMEVCRTRAAGLQRTRIWAHAARDPLMAPSTVSARDLMAFDSAAFEAASEFVARGPFAGLPFFRGIDARGHEPEQRHDGDSQCGGAWRPNNRHGAREAGRRRRSAGLVRLCASHRVIRLQPFDVPGYSPHFRLFALVTAGRERARSASKWRTCRSTCGFTCGCFRMLIAARFALQVPLWNSPTYRRRSGAGRRRSKPR